MPLYCNLIFMTSFPAVYIHVLLNPQIGPKWNKLSFKEFSGFHSKNGRIYIIQIMDILTSSKKWEMNDLFIAKLESSAGNLQVKTKFSSKSPKKKKIIPIITIKRMN